jgi:hypothetical protein
LLDWHKAFSFQPYSTTHLAHVFAVFTDNFFLAFQTLDCHRVRLVLHFLCVKKNVFLLGPGAALQVHWRQRSQCSRSVRAGGGGPTLPHFFRRIREPGAPAGTRQHRRHGPRRESAVDPAGRGGGVARGGHGTGSHLKARVLMTIFREYFLF